ncbi:MAG: type 4a pilus biogenesis protein PilO [Actinomycetales bacterium]|nr:type 4a pilus biogenesis protein PilO [Actinomycetales bacterium]
MKLDNRIWVLVTVIVSAALVAGGFFLGVQPQLTALAEAQSQQAEVDAQNAAITAEIAALQTASANLDELRARANELQLAVPDEMNSPEFISSLNALAASTGVTVTSISISPAQAYAPPVADAAPADAAATGDSPDAAATASPAAPAPSPSADPGAPVTGAPLPTTNPLIDASDFVVIPVSIAIRGGYAPSLDFVEGLRTGERLILVTKLAVTRSGDDGGATVETAIEALVYALPGSALPAFDDADAAGGSGADATPAPTDSATPAPGDSATPDPSGTPTANPLRKPVITGAR